MRPNTLADIKGRIESEYIPITETGCWLIDMHHDKDGYPTISYRGRSRRLSRMVIDIYKRPMSSGEWALHSCDNPSCINPSHLYIGTPTDNNRDTVRRGRYTKRKSSVNLNELSELLDSEISQREIAENMGISEAWVSALKNRLSAL